MTFANPAGLALLALAVPVVLLHLLRPRRQPRHVSSTFLWREVAQPVAAARPWQRLRPTALLALQLLAVVLLALAVAQPVRRTSVSLAAHTVFIVDASGSMAAMDGRPDRLAQAKEQARALRDQLPAGGVASIVAVGDQPQVLLTTSADRQAFDDALARVRTTGGTADFAGAFALAASLETPGTPIGFALFSDGGLSDEGKRLLPPGTEYQMVGRDPTNRALSRLTVEPRGSGLHARVNVRNAGGPATTQTVRFDVDGKTTTTTDVALGEGEAKDLEVDLPAGERVEAFLEGEDLLGADNHLFAVAGHRRTLKVLVAGPADPFLDAVLAATPDVEVARVEQPGSTAGYDLAIFDRVAVPAEPTVPYLAIAPPGGAPGVTVTGTVDTPSVALVRVDDPLLQDVDLSGIAIAKAQRVDAPKGVTLVGAEGAPLLVRGSDPAHPFAYLGFELSDSNLPVNIAFPILVDRLIVQLAGASLPPSDLTVGQPLPVDPGVAVTVVNPDGREVAVAPGGAAPLATMPGFWVLRSPDAEGAAVVRPERVVAVNVASAESDLRPQPDLPIPVRPESEADQTTSGQRPVLVWLIVPLLGVLLAEYLVARRRVGVAPGQWRAAVGLRLGIALLLIAALLGLSFTRPADRVATIFLIDASDSVGGPSRAESIAWVREALAHQPRDAVSGVALFGGDARLELTVDEQRELGQPAVKIDASRTNLATALRLAAAVLPEDARRRVVLVSDGRATEGETEAEADRLAEAGIQVDVHAVGATRGADIAVSSFDGPGVAHVGDQVELTAVVEATVAGPAVATLDLDGKVLGEQSVTLEVGTNRVTFRVPADTEGIDRYRVRVSSTNDTVVENNVGYAAVRVDGAQRVLVAEGVEHSGDTLVAALRSTNLAVDVVPASSLPGLDELSRYTSTVLVDVDVHDLSGEQTQALAAATRDLGRGLVTIGGDRSYGLGGYRDSDLEQLLPVISEVKDPKRKQSVAEVLAIDTSGSMSACHCAEGGAFTGMPSNNPTEGGVRKTDIARAGAARAIDALDAQDQIGLLAVTNRDDWVIDLQQVPSEDVVREGLDKIRPGGGTDLSTGLMTAAAKLRDSKASLKHIILFTDGFTSTGNLDTLVTQAKELADSGITVSVLGTGEGAAQQLEAVAKAGRGRFYPGHDMQNIPQIMQQEVQIAARSFVNEGTWFPEIVSAQDPIRDLTSSPPLLGYVATTAKPTATTLLRLGDEHDPLLATWQAGLGKVTSWTSDASARWSKQWTTWEGYAAFWSGIVRSTAPAGSTDGSVRARAVDGKLEITLESTEPFPDGATATARVTGPDLRGVDVPLVRTGPTTFVGDVAATAPGSYAVGASVTGPQGAVLSATTLASVSYSPEYRPGDIDRGTLTLVSTRTHGRGEIVATAAFDAEPLAPGIARVAVASLLLLLAALLWPVAVGLSRLALTGTPARAVGAVGRRTRGGARWVRAHLPGRPGAERPSHARAERPAPRDLDLEPPPMIDPDAKPSRAERKVAAAAPSPTVNRLLERKRGGTGSSGSSGSAGSPPADADDGSGGGAPPGIR